MSRQGRFGATVKLAYFVFIHARRNVCLIKDHYLTSAFKKKITFAVLIETAHRNAVVSQLKHHSYSFRPEVICNMENKRETVWLGVCKANVNK